MGRDASLSQVAKEGGGLVAPVHAERQFARGARGVGVDNVERRPAFDMVIGPGQIGLRDQAAPILRQRMADEAQHGPVPGNFL